MHADSGARGDGWMRGCLRLAAVYNVVWGALVVLFPLVWFDLAGLEPPRYPAIWQCVGMIVGVYGVGYWAAATDPLRHWPIVLVGFLGKVLGPLGFVKAVWAGELPLHFGWVILANDVLWWVPFGLMLWRARVQPSRSAAMSSGTRTSASMSCAAKNT